MALRARVWSGLPGLVSTSGLVQLLLGDPQRGQHRLGDLQKIRPLMQDLRPGRRALRTPSGQNVRKVGKLFLEVGKKKLFIMHSSYRCSTLS